MVPFEVPDRSEYPIRLSAVLSVIYLIYNEGYFVGERWVRDELCTEAPRLGRVLAALVPDEPEVHGLVSLMEFTASSGRAPTPDGTPILLEDQNRTKWDRAQIGRGVAALERAAQAVEKVRLGSLRFTGRARRMPRHRADGGRHRLEPDRRAVRRPHTDRTVADRRAAAVAVAMADPSEGPRLALAIVDGLTGLDGS